MLFMSSANCLLSSLSPGTGSVEDRSRSQEMIRGSEDWRRVEAGTEVSILPGKEAG